MDSPPVQIVKGLEMELLRPEVRSHPAIMAGFIADSFIEFGESGKRYSKEDVLAVMMKPAECTYAIQDFDAIPLSSSIVLAMYRVQKQDTKTGKQTFSLRSSLWQKHKGKWQLVFHQGTPLMGNT